MRGPALHPRQTGAGVAGIRESRIFGNQGERAAFLLRFDCGLCGGVG